MPKPIRLHSYNENWPKMFEVEACDLRRYLPGSCLEIHHIGSTSIPNIKAKEDLDILLVVDKLSDSHKLEKHGFVFKGELNVPLRYFFSKNTQRSKVNLHVCEKDNGFISLNLAFRNYLRDHSNEAKEYEKIKQMAAANPNAHHRIRWFLSNYGASKNDFIKSILDKSGYEGVSVNFCMHNNEWSEYHRIKEEQIFMPIKVVYDRNHPSIVHPNHFHFCMYHGSRIVAIAHIECLTTEKAALRPFCVDAPFQKQGFGKTFLKFLEKWLQLKKVKLLLLHANINSVAFYEKQGYQFMSFDDPTGGLPSESKDMGKFIL